MQLFGQETPSRPVVPDLKTRKLRAKLMLEECLETIRLGLGLSIMVNARAEHDMKAGEEAWLHLTNDNAKPDDIEFDDSEGRSPDLVQIADGCGDSDYVGPCGTALACGIDMEEVFDEIHHSNMSKLWMDAELPRITDESWKVQYIKSYDLYLVKNSDGKVIKSPSYSPANLKDIIDRQIVRAL